MAANAWRKFFLIGATIGPALAGVLIGWGWSRPLYWTALAAPALVAAFLAVAAAARAARIRSLINSDGE